ncbi:MAG: MurT ligase domain-containing protein [Lactovum sp.]
MTLATFFAKITGKSVAWILETLFHRGSTLPGQIAQKLDPNILSSLSQSYEVIFITGTNGKTLTTALTTAIFKEAGFEVLTNTSGANMITGITSTFLKAKKKEKQKQFAILEIDEASLPKVTDAIKPSLFVFTNIFRDQMDRYGEIYSTYNFLVESSKKAPEATVLLNADSPIFNSKKLENPLKFYGFATEETLPKRAHYNTEGILCPHCHSILDYKMNSYANLGNYLCQNCGFTRPPLDTALTELRELSIHSSEFNIDGEHYKINIGGLYNVYNALTAVAIANFYGLDKEIITAGFEKSKAIFGRQESFNLEGKTVTIILIKNPVGANQAIDLLGLEKEGFSLVTLLNANYADGIDTSWIWDVNFEKLTDFNIHSVITGGVRSDEISRRLLVAGLSQASSSKDLQAVLSKIKSEKSKQVYVLATYTAMLEFRELLAKENYISAEMK